jgi:hypothetical protein
MMITWYLVLHNLSKVITLYLMSNDFRSIHAKFFSFWWFASHDLSFLDYCMFEMENYGMLKA